MIDLMPFTVLHCSDRAHAELQIKTLLQDGVTTFLCLQASSFHAQANLAKNPTKLLLSLPEALHVSSNTGRLELTCVLHCQYYTLSVAHHPESLKTLLGTGRIATTGQNEGLWLQRIYGL